MSSLDIKSIDDLSDFEKLSLTEFSYSRIDTYEMCPSKYFFSYIKREPRQFGEAAVLGNIVHAVLEDVVSSTDTLSFDDMKSKYQEHTLSLDPNSQISKSLISVGHEIIEEFYDTNEGKLFDVFEKEMGFKFIIGNYLIIGFIDRVDVVGDSVHIVDYKTGKREVAAKDVHSNLQLGIYALAASHFFPGKEITASLHYLRTNRLKSHTYSNEDLDLIKSNLIKRINNIMSDQNFLPTKNERFCSFCDHAKSGACRNRRSKIKKV